VRHLAGRRLQSFGHDACHERIGQRRDARRPRLVAQQAVHAFRREPLLPASHAGLSDAGLPHDLGRAFAGRGQQHDPAAPHVFLRAVAIRGDGIETSPIRRIQVDGDPGMHRADSHDRERTGIRIPTLPSGFIH
jgi:hypothetical protein